MRLARSIALGTLVAALASAVPSRTAWAVEGSTDYTVTTPTGLYEAPPAGAVAVVIASQYGGQNVALPFQFPFFGIQYAQTAVTPTGYIQFGVASGQGQAQNAGLLSGVTVTSAWDGMCAPLWDNIFYGQILTWTAGTAPDRRFVVSWENFQAVNGSGSKVSFQVKLFETSGKIQFAYKPDGVPSTWIGFNHIDGIVAPGADPRWTAVTTNALKTTRPASDFELTPRVIHFTGKLVYDRPVPTSAGIPAVASSGIWLKGVRVETRYSPTGPVNAAATTDLFGDFDIAAFVGPSALPAELYAVTAAPSCSVAPTAGGTPYAFQLATGLTFAGDLALGTKQITAAADPSAAFRAPAAITSALQRAYWFADPLIADPIPVLNVVYNSADTAATSYAGGATPALRIAGPASSNLDAWDDPVVIRTYTRHLLASAAAPTGSFYDDRFDAVTDDANAFAEGAGYYVAAAVTGNRHFIDGTGPSSATDIDLEDPQPVSAKGPDVAAWVAAALYDTIDPANEVQDRLDGSLGPGFVLSIADRLTTAPTALKLFKAWAAQFDANALGRDFVHHGLIPDDAFEPNDDTGEPAPLGAPGVRRDALVLNTHGEDWFSTELAEAAPSLIAEVSFVRTTYPAGIEIDVYAPDGSLAATKTDIGGLGPVVAQTGPVGPGTYRVRVRHLQGEIVAAYTFQVSRRMDIGAGTSLKSWTVGRPYDDPIPLVGGIPPFSFTILPGPYGIAGVGLNAATLHATGNPTQVGVYDFTISTTDGGNPGHVAQSTHHVIIHPALDFPLSEFLGVAKDHAVDVTLPKSGGTPPYTFAVGEGSLPAGLALDADELRIRGTAASPGKSALSIDGTDVAGSAHREAVTAVVCIPFAGARTPLDVAAGGAASGFWVDAVKGSSVSFSATTAKGRTKRALRAAVVAADATDVAGAVVKGGNGKASASKVVAAESGRVFFIVESDAGDATQVLGTAAVKPPGKGKGVVDPLAVGGAFDVEFGALASATLTLSAKADPKSGLALNVLSLLDPDGQPVPLGGLVTTKGTTLVLAATLAKSGTYTVRVRGTGDRAGKVTWSYALKQPKDVTYSAD